MTGKRTAWVVLVAAAAFVAQAAEGSNATGGRTWKAKTDLDVSWSSRTEEEAGVTTETDQTAAMQELGWEVRSSGTAVTYEYGFNETFSTFAEVGPLSLALTRKDPADGSETSWVFNDATSYAFGAKAGGELRGRTGRFWSASFALKGIASASYKTPGDLPHKVTYDEFGFCLGGTFGAEVRGAKVYGGLRLTSLDAELQEEYMHRNKDIDITETTSFDRDSFLELVIGTRVGTEGADAFLEASIIGTFGVTAGLAFRF